MGIDANSAKFLRSESRRGLSFGRMLTLGRQMMYFPADGGSIGDYAEGFFKGLGAETIDAMDISAYEGSNVLHDLNEPIQPKLRENYDCVFDGGALEHVFNFPMALRNCMEMVKVGGHFITIAPMNNYSGHGFYQFSPELFYAALEPANGYTIQRMLLAHAGRWYSVREPRQVQKRVELITNERMLLFVTARRNEQKPIFSAWPQQSDYVANWAQGSAGQAHQGRFAWAGSIPLLRKVREHWRAYYERRRCSPENRGWFEPVELD
jgi:hypothetical protein